MTKVETGPFHLSWSVLDSANFNGKVDERGSKRRKVRQQALPNKGWTNLPAHDPNRV